MDNFEHELKLIFLDESAQLLAETEQCFLDLESRPEDSSILEKIFRLAHNLKGGASSAGFPAMGEFTHYLESLLIKLRNGEMKIDSFVIELLLLCNDHIKNWIKLLCIDLNASMDSEKLLYELKNKLNPEKRDQEEILKEDMLLFSPAVEPSLPAASEGIIRVNLTRLESLMDNVGELVILQTVLNQQGQQGSSPLMQNTIVQLAKITKEIQEASMSLRMIPLRKTFQKMQRIIRDTAKSLDKKIIFQLSGEETEIDKNVVEGLSDPLIHLVRNAVDHGIEDAAIRKRASKPEQGKISLNAYHRGNKTVIEIWDDGAGLEPEMLKRMAREKGILEHDKELTDKEAYRLIFTPGFSTRTDVTEISGRGVGMDVVKNSIEKLLQGEVEIESKIGEGTCFRIILPLTLAIIDGIIVSSDKERYIIPMAHVYESIRPKKDDLHTITGLGEVLRLRGENLPLFRLGELLGSRERIKNPWESTVFVVRTGDKPFSIMVDEIIGQQQVVIKQLGAEIRHLKGVSGGAILGDGHAALILDLSELILN